MNYVNQLFSFIIIFGSYFSFQPCVCNGYCNIWQMDVNDVTFVPVKCMIIGLSFEIWAKP